MKLKADRQLEQISLNEIKEILKKTSPEFYGKMIITDGQQFKRGDYLFTKLAYQKVDRQLKIVKFPLLSSLKDSFSEFEGGTIKFGEKSLIKTETLFETLDRLHKIKGQAFNKSNSQNLFTFPLDTSGNEISRKQLKYFIPELTYQEACSECRGEKYIQCQDYECHGQHTWSCRECQGQGDVTCDECRGDGKNRCKNCSGHGYVKCGSGASGFLKRNMVGNIAGGGCRGTGQVKDTTASGGFRTCKTCRGRGEVPCEDCGTRGEIKCESCTGRGEMRCIECSGKGTKTCTKCYGDRERYGKIDCPQCKTTGIMAQIVYVDTFLSENEVEKVFQLGENLNLNDKNIIKHVSSNRQSKLVYKQINDKIEEDYDEYSDKYSELLISELGLKKHSYPKVIKEEIYYQIIPCVELNYKHILTNSIHNFTIVNIFDNPEIIFHSNPEHLKQDLGNATKAVGGFFSKLFKTKGFKSKEDKRNEVVLLIHMAKIDGIIEEEEKHQLSEMIGNLEEFTNSEKQKLFDLLNSINLPEVSKTDVIFSSKEREQDVLNKLKVLATADGQMKISEQEFYDKIKAMMGI